MSGYNYNNNNNNSNENIYNNSIENTVNIRDINFDINQDNIIKKSNEFTTPLKFFINKIWTNSIINNYEKGLDNLNKDFSNNLRIIQNINETKNYSGIYVDKNFEKGRFGFFSHSKIKSVTFVPENENDSYILLDVHTNNSIFKFPKTTGILNKLRSNGLFNYEINIKDHKLFTTINDNEDSKIKYSIDFLDRLNRSNDDIINNPYISSEKLKFYSNLIIQDSKDFSIIANEEYFIERFDYMGYIFNCSISEAEIFAIYKNLKNIIYKYNNIEVFILNYDSSGNIDIIGADIDLKTSNNLSINLNCGIEYYKIINNNNNLITILNIINKIDIYPVFFKFWTETSFTPSENHDVYIEIDHEYFKLEYNYNEEYFFIDSDISNGGKDKNIKININKVYSLIKFTKINSVIKAPFEFIKLNLNRNIKEYFYYLQKNTKLISNIKNFNYSNSNIIIERIDYISDSILGLTFAQSPNILISITDGLNNQILNDKIITNINNPITVFFKTNVDTKTFTFNDIIAVNGNLTNFNGFGSLYSVNFTPLKEGDCEIIVPLDTFSDELGNNNKKESRFKFILNREDLIISITSKEVLSDMTTNDEKISLTILINGTTLDFTIDDISVENGIIKNFEGSLNNYQATFIPLKEGICRIYVEDNKFTDSTNRSNIHSEIFTWTYNLETVKEEIISFETLFNEKIINHEYRVGESISYDIKKINHDDLIAYSIENNLKLLPEDLSNKINILKFDYENLDPILYNGDIITITGYNTNNSIINIENDKIVFLLKFNTTATTILPYFANGINDYDINESNFYIWKETDLANSIIKSKISIRNNIDGNTNSSRLYMIFNIENLFAFSEYYNLPDYLKINDNDNNKVINIKLLFNSTNFSKLKEITEIIGEYLWKSDDIYTINTELDDPIKINIPINYTVTNFSLYDSNINGTKYYGDGSANNFNSNFDSNTFKFFTLNDKLYGMIRLSNTNPLLDFNNPLIGNQSNSSNMYLELNIKQEYTISKKYIVNDNRFTPNNFNNLINNINFNTISITKNESYNEYLEKIILLDQIKNYNIYLKMIETNLGNHILLTFNILNIKHDDDFYILQLNNTFLRNTASTYSYEIIYKLKESNIIEEEYSNTLQIKTTDNIDSIHFNTTNNFLPYIQFLNNNYSEYLNKFIYTLRFSTSIDLDIQNLLTKQIILLVNNKNYTVDIILLKLLVSQTTATQNIYKIVIGSKNIINFKNSTIFDILTLVDNITIPVNDPQLGYNEEENRYMFNTFIDSLFIKNINSNTILVRTKELYIWYFLFNNYVYEEGDGHALLRFKFSDKFLKNNSYYDIGFKKVPDSFEYKKTTTETIIEPQWIKELPMKIFKEIKITIDDNIIEKLNLNTYDILYSFNYNIFKETSLDKLLRIRYDQDNNIYFYFPLKFFFTNGSKYLPIFCMKKSSCKVILSINDPKELLKNSDKFKNIPKISLDVNYSSIILDEKDKKIFKENNKNYLAQISYFYSDILLGQSRNINTLNINGLVKDIFFYINSNERNNIIENDIIYKKYLENYDIFKNDPKLYKITNQSLFVIFNNIEEEIKNLSNRILLFTKNNILSKIDFKFLIYLDEMYLQYLNEDLNNINIFHHKKLQILILYILNIYKNNITNNEANIKSLSLFVNGQQITPELSGNYFNDVIPYLKGYTLKDNYYVYSFGCNSKIKQPNGYLNFKTINDFQIKTVLNDNISEAKLKIYTKEYKIIQFKEDKAKILS